MLRGVSTIIQENTVTEHSTQFSTNNISRRQARSGCQNYLLSYILPIPRDKESMFNYYLHRQVVYQYCPENRQSYSPVPALPSSSSTATLEPWERCRLFLFSVQFLGTRSENLVVASVSSSSVVVTSLGMSTTVVVSCHDTTPDRSTTPSVSRIILPTRFSNGYPEYGSHKFRVSMPSVHLSCRADTP